MRAKVVWLVLVLWCGGAVAQTAPSTDVLGSHDLSLAPMSGPTSASCLYCHAPHSGIGGNTPLWSQQLSTQAYTTYASTTMQNKTEQPVAGGPSSLCLSCHDGTVAPGSEVPYGKLTLSGQMLGTDVFGTTLTTSHPFSLTPPLADSADLAPSLAASHLTADPAQKVQLVNNNVECTSCHEPHTQNIDPRSRNFLVKDNANGQVCLACHTTADRTVNSRSNPLSQWSTSIHATSGNGVTGDAKLGGYTTVAQFACLSCHVPHRATRADGLLRGPSPAPANIDTTSQSCMACHAGGTGLEQAIPGIFAEIAKGGHPYPAGTNTHQVPEAAVLVNNRHAACTDCHDPHKPLITADLAAPPNLRPSQNGAIGIDASDGTTVRTPATYQYETCLRCHGTSPGKQNLSSVFGYLPSRQTGGTDPLDVIPQFGPAALSCHPVMQNSIFTLPQPSLRTYMLNLDGTTDSSRSMPSGSRLFCTDCHSSDDTREFGGAAAIGPHGSQWHHILERRYEASQVAPGTDFPNTGPGSLIITNLSPSPNLNSGKLNPGPYALCGKCHDLNNVLSDASFKPNGAGRGGHFTHVSTVGASCSVCHTGHGLGSITSNASGERLVSFDLNVVGPNGSSAISYSRASNTCTLTCHGRYHDANGAVRPVTSAP